MNYQLENFRVTAINVNPVKIRVDQYRQKNSLSGLVKIDCPADKRHNYVNGVNISLYIDNILGTGQYASYLNLSAHHTDKQSFKIGDGVGYGGAITAYREYTSATTMNFSLSTSNAYEFINYVVIRGGVNNTQDGNGKIANMNNIYVGYVWGSKAVPTIESDVVNSFVKHYESFEINFNCKNNALIAEQFSVKSGIFYYREIGTSSYANMAFTGTKLIIPANKLANGKHYESYASITVDDNQVASSPVIKLNTIDTIPTCNLSYPINLITYGVVDFKWNYINKSGARQYAYDLAVSYDSGINWSNVVSNNVTETQTTKLKINSGDILWKVKVYNQNNIASAWSDVASFINNVPPETPIISRVTQSGRPTINWSSTSQAAYQIKIDHIYDSGIQYTSDKFHLINAYLKNRNYIIKLRIANKFGKFSEWTTYEYTQSINIDKPICAFENAEEGVRINIIHNDMFEKYYIIRDGVVVGITKNDDYTDLYAFKEHVYIVRGVDYNDLFSDFETQFNYTAPFTQLIHVNSEKLFDISERWESVADLEISYSKDYSDSIYFGNTKKHHHEGKLLNKVFKINCETDFDKFGDVCFFKSYKGYGGFVRCNEASKVVKWFGDDTELILEETEFEEGIEYEL